MNSKARLILACLAAAAISTSASAQLSAEYRDWAKGPVQHIMTDEEQGRWKQIKTDQEAKAFVDLFWARRDPTPATPENEFRVEFDQRVDYADRQFTQGRKKGSMTDRGRIIIALGAPARIQRDRPASTGAAMPGGSNESQQKQVWVYEQAKSPFLGQATANVGFVDQFGSNDWTIERTTGADLKTLTGRAVQSYIVSPNLTAAPSYQAAAAPPQAAPEITAQIPPPTTPPAVLDALKTEALRTALTEFQSAKSNPYKPISITYTEMLSPSGEYFVPVQLYIPKSAGLTADAITTFFGVVEDASGNRVASFEEAAKLSSSKGDLYFDKSLTLKPGKYRATLGLAAADGKPAVISTAPMELKEIAPASSGVSRLVVSNDVHETQEAAPPGAPYAFGRLKLVPKGDRVFTNKDEITYFLEVFNPAVDEGTNLPKIQVKLELEGAGKAGKPGRKISAPLADAVPLPLTGTTGPGHYALIASIPLGSMSRPIEPGDYTLRVKVYDQVKKQSWDTEQPLKIVEAAPAS